MNEYVPFFERTEKGYLDWFAYRCNGFTEVRTLFVDFRKDEDFHILDFSEWLDKVQIEKKCCPKLDLILDRDRIYKLVNDYYKGTSKCVLDRYFNVGNDTSKVRDTFTTRQVGNEGQHQFIL